MTTTTAPTLVNRNVYEPFDPAINEFVHRHGLKLFHEARGWDIRYIMPTPEWNTEACLVVTSPDENNHVSVVAVDHDRYLRESIDADVNTIGQALEKAWVIFQTAKKKTFS